MYLVWSRILRPKYSVVPRSAFLICSLFLHFSFSEGGGALTSFWTGKYIGIIKSACFFNIQTFQTCMFAIVLSGFS